MQKETQHLSSIFQAQTIVVIGGNKINVDLELRLIKHILNNNFTGKVYYINTTGEPFLELTTYSSITDIDTTVDLAIICTEEIIQIINDCIQVGVKGAVIISDGWKLDRSLEEQIHAIARGKLRIIGPNSIGFINPHHSLNATCAHQKPRPGNVAFISESAAIYSAVLDWSQREKVGFSGLVSIGSMIDVDWADLIYYFGDDPHTKAIVLYMESIPHPRAFLSAAREIALSKPIIVLKPGETESAIEEIYHYRGYKEGSHGVFSAVCQRCGIVEVKRIAELLYIAELLAKGARLPKGPNLSIITNARGAGILATDGLITTGGKLATLTPGTIEKLNGFLPKDSHRGNPIDISGDADSNRYAKTLEVVLQDSNTDGVLVILTPQSGTNPLETARKLITCRTQYSKPILACWMGGEEIAEAEAFLNTNQIPTYPYPDSAAGLFNFLWQWSYNLHAIYETPITDANPLNPRARESVATIINEAVSNRREELERSLCFSILSVYDIPIANNSDNASSNEPYELLLRSYIDRQFGPVILFGAGGRIGEIYKDYSFGLPPLNDVLSKRMAEKTKIYQALQGKINEILLNQIIVNFSELVIEQPWLKSTEINLLIPNEREIIVSAVRMWLHPADIKVLPAPVIRSYPLHWSSEFLTRDNQLLHIRPIRPSDEPLIKEFHAHLSEQSIYFRFFHLVNLTRQSAYERLTRFCFVDYDREIVLVALREGQLLGVGRLSRIHGVDEGEFSLLVSDRFQGQGLGTQLLKRLVEIGRLEGVKVIRGQILSENKSMQKVCKKLGFVIHKKPDVVEVYFDLNHRGTEDTEGKSSI